MSISYASSGTSSLSRGGGVLIVVVVVVVVVVVPFSPQREQAACVIKPKGFWQIVSQTPLPTPCIMFGIKS